MSCQRFAARVATKYENGAVGWAPGGPFDCLGPFAKVQNCPVVIDRREVARHTCYATGYADTWFSIPACTRHKGRYVSGFMTTDDFQSPDGAWHRVVIFCPNNVHKPKFV